MTSNPHYRADSLQRRSSEGRARRIKNLRITGARRRPIVQGKEEEKNCVEPGGNGQTVTRSIRSKRQLANLLFFSLFRSHATES